jgi:hypothetical protein
VDRYFALLAVSALTSIKPAARLQRTWWSVRQATRFHACLPGAGVKHTRFSNA